MAGYFGRLVSETSSRAWINNPTNAEIDLALAQGAVGSTTNPSYLGGLLRRAPAQVVPVVDALLAEHPDADERQIAILVQQRMAQRIVDRFRALFDASGGAAGFVSIQGSPETDMDGKQIWAEAQANRAVGPNATPKLPATLPGFVAMERAVERGWPIILTEVFT